MAHLPESSTWEPGIYQLETTDPVIGGLNGISNQQGKHLANRTKYLKTIADDHETRITATENSASVFRKLKGAATLVKHGVVSSYFNPTKGIFDFISVAKLSTSPILNRVNIFANPSAPIIFSFSKGYDANGPIVYYARIAVTPDSVDSGSNSPGLLYAEYNETTGDVEFGLDTTTTSVVVSYNDPSTTGYWYSLKDECMYKWNAGISDWDVVLRIIVASINWNGSGSYTYFIPIGKGVKDVYGRGHVPAGTVNAYAGATAPDGFLLCDGGAISRSIYSDLFAAIGTTYGTGNGSTTFNLPDLRGEFVRGLDNGRGVDTGRTLGSAQADAFKSHQHINQSVSLPTGKTDTLSAGSGIFVGGGSSVNTQATGGTETRPRNIAMNYIIKF